MVARKRKVKADALDLDAPVVAPEPDASVAVSVESEAPIPVTEPVVSEATVAVEAPVTDPKSEPANADMAGIMEQMSKMQALIEKQAAALMKQQEGVPKEEEEVVEEAPSMGWPEVKDDEEPKEVLEEKPDAPEAPDRSLNELYACDTNEQNDPNIMLADASKGVLGEVTQNPTHVGLRTRGLLLNHTLQQPSIGGLV